MAEFMIYDKDGSGTVNEDECMEMMYVPFYSFYSIISQEKM